MTAALLLLLSQQAPPPFVEGVASYYNVESSSTLTANGETFTGEDMTCAMRKGEFGSNLLVVAENGNTVEVRLNDRGPYVDGRVIDLSEAAMRELCPDSGLLEVKVYYLGKGD